MTARAESPAPGRSETIVTRRTTSGGDGPTVLTSDEHDRLEELLEEIGEHPVVRTRLLLVLKVDAVKRILYRAWESTFFQSPSERDAPFIAHGSDES